MADKDYYSILGVARSASDKELKQAYRRLARKLHPDVNPADKKAEEQFKKVNEAYEVLSDKDKRGKYDQYGDNWQHADQYARAGAAGNGAGGTWSGSSGFDFGGVGDAEGIFDSLFGRRRSTSRRPRRGTDVDHPTEVTLEEAYRGAARLLSLQVDEVCEKCKGAGSSISGRCSACMGTGTNVTVKKIEITIPPGVSDGSRVKITGAGNTGYWGGPKGDLYLIVSVRPNDKFQREGNNLHTEIPVPFLTALLGGEVEVPTITGKVALKVPAETQNGRVFRLAGMGMPHLSGAGKGDLYAKVSVVLPAKLNDKQKQLLEELQAIT
ncbi:MAG: hypothetical protein EXR50_04430 [Dehalococcoidia bacterium]|nr:hypothetical protein [Dehalococcoidia bacterium]